MNYYKVNKSKSTDKYITKVERVSNKLRIKLARIALNGAIHALNEEDYDDKFVHFTHSLREILELVAKKQIDGERIKKIDGRERGQLVLKNIKKIRKMYLKNNKSGIKDIEIKIDGKIYYEQDIIKKLNKIYDKLSKYAHHHNYGELDQKQAEDILKEVVEMLHELLVPKDDHHID